MEGEGEATAPRLTIIVPTLNAARTLAACLASIRAQCSGEATELLVIDGRSTDGTQEIARRYGATLLPNPLKTGEAGKAAGVRAATGDILAFVDSDNILVGTDWLKRMLAPFAEPDIAGAEPIRYEVRPSDGYLTRYFASLGMNDPICLFLGNYDRQCVLTGRWTEMPVGVATRSGYEKIWLRPGATPTIGANGFLVRRAALLAADIGEYLFDVDVVQRLVADGRWAFAKVRCGIVHLFAADVRTFRRKQRRRIRDFLHYRRQGLRASDAGGLRQRGLVSFVVATVLGWPLIWQALKGYRRTGDAAWLFHPAACALTLYEYGAGLLFGRRRAGPLHREGWRQC